MTLQGEEIEVLPLDTAGTKAEVVSDGFSLWRIKFPQVVSSTRDSYVRIRFRLLRSEKLWEWHKCAFVRNRAVVDFRVADARGVTAVPNANALVRRLLPVERLNLFVIAPFWLRMRFASPNLEYTRLFEGAIWEKYLDRATGLWRTDKLVIYQWEATDVGPQKPYRAFLELDREPAVISLGNHVGCNPETDTSAVR